MDTAEGPEKAVRTVQNSGSFKASWFLGKGYRRGSMEKAVRTVVASRIQQTAMH